jgi:ATP/maltotriose-dependent transcriptional regulator MalT
MVLYVLGRLALMQGDAPRALALLEECLARARAAGDTLFQALPLLLLGQMALTQGDLATAQERLEEEVALSQGTGERMTTPYALTLQGLIRWRQGKMDEAQASFKEGVRLYREQGIGLGIARLLLLLGHIAVEEGNMAEARADYAESLTIAREIEVEGFTATGLKGSGVVVAKAGQLALAARLWGATEQLRESQDISIPAAVYEQAVQAARTQLGEQAFAIAWAEGRTMSLEQVLAALETATLPEAPQMATTIETSSSYPAGLTAREVEVLGLLARGWTDAKIAEQLVISPRTVNTHLTAIYGKIGVTSRSAATRYAIEHKLV